VAALLKFRSMKISQKIRADHGDGSSAVATDFDADALAGMQAKSEEFAATGNRVYLPLAD
jgi:phosphomethylpyrimidine synthase